MEGTIKKTFDLVEALRKKFPGKRLVLDQPGSPKGSGYIDEVGPFDYTVVIRANDFGLYLTHEDKAFCGPDEVFATADLLLARIDELVAGAA